MDLLQGQKFVAVGAESRYLSFAATNRDNLLFPRKVAIFCGILLQIAISFTLNSQIPGNPAF